MTIRGDSDPVCRDDLADCSEVIEEIWEKVHWDVLARFIFVAGFVCCN